MPTRRVLVHDCEPQVDNGRKFGCSCTRRITSRDARALVAGRQGRWKLQLMAGGGLVEVHSEVILAARRHRLNARVVSDKDIDRAYVQEIGTEQIRIDAVGESQVDALVELGAERREA